MNTENMSSPKKESRSLIPHLNPRSTLTSQARQMRSRLTKGSEKLNICSLSNRSSERGLQRSTASSICDEMSKSSPRIKEVTISKANTYTKELLDNNSEKNHEVKSLEPSSQTMDHNQFTTRDSLFSSAAGETEETVQIGDHVELTKEILELPSQLIGLCHEVLIKDNTNMETILQHYQPGDSNLMQILNQWKVENEELKTLLGTISQQTEKNTLTISTKISNLAQQATLIQSKFNQQMEQNSKMKIELEAAEKQIQLYSKTSKVESCRMPFKTLTSKINSTNESKKGDTEMTEVNILQQTVKQLELELKRTKTRVRDLEKQIKDKDNQITNASNNLLSVEQQAKQRETQHEQRLRTLRENLTTAQQKMTDNFEQKDTLQKRVLDLEKTLKETIAEGEEKVKASNKIIKELGIELEEERKQYENTAQYLRDAYQKAQLLGDKCRFLLEMTQNKAQSETKTEDDLLPVLQLSSHIIANAENELNNMKEENSKLKSELALLNTNRYATQNEEGEESLLKILKDKEIQINILVDENKNMENSEKRLQWRRIQYEKKIANLEQELETVKSSRRWYSANLYDKFLSELLYTDASFAEISNNILREESKNYKLEENIVEHDKEPGYIYSYNSNSEQNEIKNIDPLTKTFDDSDQICMMYPRNEKCNLDLDQIYEEPKENMIPQPFQIQVTNPNCFISREHSYLQQNKTPTVRDKIRYVRQ